MRYCVRAYVFQVSCDKAVLCAYVLQFKTSEIAQSFSSTFRKFTDLAQIANAQISVRFESFDLDRDNRITLQEFDN